jgi:transcriptional regulator of heat shock response
MDKRQEKLLFNIIEEHIGSAKAVGSSFLAEKYGLEVSPATIRNDMVELEESDYIFQPHISAGRVPTEKGYHYYIKNNISKEGKVGRREMEILEKAVREIEKGEEVAGEKNLAKIMAELTDAAVFLAWSKNDVYYTGISKLLSQPEFNDFNLVHNISLVVDKCDDILDEIFDNIKETEIKIGRDNDFSPSCASILTKVNGRLLGILGPIRMDYNKNLGVVNYTRKLLKQ